MAKVERFEDQTLEDLYAKVEELRVMAVDIRTQTKVLNEEIARREAEIAESKRAGREQVIGR